MNTTTLRRVSWLGGAVLVGALGYLVLGPRPPDALSAGLAGGDTAWNLPPPATVGGGAAAGAWDEIDPWKARAAAPAAEVEPPVPPAVPVAIVRDGGRWRAVFIRAGVEQRAGAGERLYGGGQVRSVDEMTVRWVDDQGQAHVRELFADPVPVLEPAREPALQPSGAGNAPVEPGQ